MIFWPRAIRANIWISPEEARAMFKAAETAPTIPTHVWQRLEANGLVKLGSIPAVDWEQLGKLAWPITSLCESCFRPLASKVETCDSCSGSICGRCSDRHRLHSCSSPYAHLAPDS
jgi:hypothetical protein